MREHVHARVADTTPQFSADSPDIADVDSNGVAEARMTCFVSCRGDVRPDKMKTIMFEGKNKHVLRGETLLRFRRAHGRQPQG